MSSTLIIIEDHTLVRTGIRFLLDNTADFAVVGEFGDGREAIEACESFNPDIILADIEMRLLNGIEVARQIHAEMPKIKIVMLSMHDDPKFVFEAFKAGASGYILKGAAAPELIEALQAVVKGERYMPPSLRDTVGEKPLDVADSASLDALDTLSSREREILQLISEGHSSLQVGNIIHISPRTIEWHRRKLMQKLGIHTIAELTKFAIRHGLTALR